MPYNKSGDEIVEKSLRIYRSPFGRIPYLEWFGKLKDRRARQAIQARLARVRLGNFGDTRSVGEGVSELRITFGPGYRIYFGRDGNEIVILLCGGDKRTQDEDLKKAKAFWTDYKKEKSFANY